MNSTNHDLARAAAEKCQSYDTINFYCVEEMAREIADTYSESMAKLDRLQRAEFKQYYRSLYDGRDRDERLD